MNEQKVEKEITDVEVLDIEETVPEISLEESDTEVDADVETEVLEDSEALTQIIRKSVRQLRAEKLASMELEMNEMDESNYKKKQIENKIAEKKKKWFPNVFWYSSIKGTYKKLTKEDVQIGATQEEVETEEKILD